MNPRDHIKRDLDLLEAVERSPNLNQRALASQAGIALGLANSCLRRLARKGMIKVREAPGRRYLYYLTPKGLAEKSRLTYEYIHSSVRFYSQARQRCRRLIGRLEKLGAARIALVGASDLAEIAYLSLMESAVAFEAVYDDQRAGESFFGHRIRPLAECPPAGGDYYILYTGLKSPREDETLQPLGLLEIL